MKQQREPYHELLRLSTRPVFLITDIVGVALLLGSQYVGAPGSAGSAAIAAVGSALLAIGFSLPVGLFYQLKSNAEALGILDTCSRAGIRGLFKNRQEDSAKLRVSIDSAAATSESLLLLGIAFRSLFNPSGDYTRQIRERLDDPRIDLRVLLLDPDSSAARSRASKERGNTTIDDIRYTLNHGLPTTVQERLKRALNGRPASTLTHTDALHLANCEVHVYSSDPAMFMMAFSDSIFVEQYHLGRPAGLRAGSCIGKHVPVIEYTGSAYAVTFYRGHFEELWSSSVDATPRVVEQALAGLMRSQD